MIAFHRLKVPLPFALRYVNSYIFEETGGLTIVDPGIHTEETVQVWQAWLAERGWTWASIHRIVLTHHHPDHYGFAGRMQQLSGGAPVWMARKSYEQTQRLWVGERDLGRSQFAGFKQHGLLEEMWQPMSDHMDNYLVQVSPHPEVQFIEPGERIRLGEGEWLAVELSGHAFGQLGFYEETTKQFIVGDHVLPQITPNVAYLPDVDTDPLATFITALQHIQTYEVSMAYPGHRDPFEGLRERAEHIIEHHEERLQKMITILREQGAMTAYEVCIVTFGDKLGVHQMRFALSETIAHLYHLVNRGLLVEQQVDSVRKFSKL